MIPKSWNEDKHETVRDMGLGLRGNPRWSHRSEKRFVGVGVDRGFGHEQAGDDGRSVYEPSWNVKRVLAAGLGDLDGRLDRHGPGPGPDRGARWGR